MASYCHSDNLIQTGIFHTPLPFIPSHEGAGTVVAGGSSVSDWVGQRIMCGVLFHPCGTCIDCTDPAQSRTQYCVGVEGHCGVHRDGFFAEYAVCDARTTTRLVDEISLVSAAPLACAGRTIWRAIEQARLEPGQWLGIVGSGGGLGHLGVQFAKKKGLKVVGIDARDDGLDLTQQSGADLVLDAREGQDAIISRVKKVTGLGCDATITVSDAGSAAGLACAVTKMHGTMVQVAAPPDNILLPFQDVIFRNIAIKASVLCSPEESEAMVRFIADKGITVKTNIFHGLSQIVDLLQLVHSGKNQGKALIIVDQEQIDRERQLGAKY